MPALFSHLPLLPIVSTNEAPSEELLQPLARIAPILVPASALKSVLGVLPATSEYWALLKEDIPLDIAVGLLDAGACKIVTPNLQLIDQIPADRLVLALNHASLETAVAEAGEDLPSKISGILLEAPLTQSGFDKSVVAAARTALGGKSSRDSKDLFVLPANDAKPTLQQLEEVSSWRLGTTPSLMTTFLSATPPPVEVTGLDKLPSPKTPTGYHIPIDVLFLSSLTTDRTDTLYATSVTSINSQPLGLVYSSPLSLSLSIYHAQATYYSRSRESLWVKGATSGATQSVVAIRRDCDGDALEFIVEQKPGTGFCHTPRATSCFGPTGGLIALEETLRERQANAPKGSYTKRLFDDATLLEAKIREEADEVVRAKNWEETRLEAADLLYFLMVRCATMGVSLADVCNVLDTRACKVTRRPGNAKPPFLKASSSGSVGTMADLTPKTAPRDLPKTSSPTKMDVVPEHVVPDEEPIVPPVYDMAKLSESERQDLLKRPLTDSREMLEKVNPILTAVRTKGDAALLNYVATLDRCKAAAEPLTQDKPFNIVMQAPFHESLMVLPEKTKNAIDVAFANIHKFHAKQMEKESQPIKVETMPGVVCSRFARAIDRVGLYVPGGTAVLPSTAMMLGIPALIAGCQHISFATPPNAEGVVRPEIVYIAHKCGAQEIVRAGGAHAVASMAYGTESVTKVDKIFGPGNQWVTAAKMAVSMDLGACVGIDMPAGPSEVLVIADKTANSVFAAADLLSQAEHGVDSQVVLLAIDLTDEHLDEIKEQVHKQALVLPRAEIVRKCIKQSLILRLPTREDALQFSNDYAPEHLILHLEDAASSLEHIRNAGSVFVGKWSPESLGDYASGTNHTLPTSAFARQYSGVSTSSFLKHITSQQLTAEGLKLLGPTVDHLAQIEGLDAHARAVTLRLASADIQ